MWRGRPDFATARRRASGRNAVHTIAGSPLPAHQPEQQVVPAAVLQVGLRTVVRPSALFRCLHEGRRGRRKQRQGQRQRAGAFQGAPEMIGVRQTLAKSELCIVLVVCVVFVLLCFVFVLLCFGTVYFVLFLPFCSVSFCFVSHELF